MFERTKNLPEDLEEVVKRYEKFTGDNIDDINCLQSWMEKQPHLPKLTNHEISFFLTLENLSLEQTKATIEEYFTLKTIYKPFFQNRLPSPKEVRKSMEMVEVCCPSELIIDGRRLAMIRLVDYDASKVDFLRDFKMIMAGWDYEAAKNLFHNGLILVADATGVNMSHALKMNLQVVYISLRLGEMIASKVHQIHVINCNPIVAHITRIITPLMAEETKKILFFHAVNEMEKFYQVIPKEYLPSTYGGHKPSMTEYNLEFQKSFEHAYRWVEYWDTKFTDESKRPKNSRRSADLMAGSFRQLEID